VVTTAKINRQERRRRRARSMASPVPTMSTAATAAGSPLDPPLSEDLVAAAGAASRADGEGETENRSPLAPLGVSPGATTGLDPGAELGENVVSGGIDGSENVGDAPPELLPPL
jgi:hypothetical protein